MSREASKPNAAGIPATAGLSTTPQQAAFVGAASAAKPARAKAREHASNCRHIHNFTANASLCRKRFRREASKPNAADIPAIAGLSTTQQHPASVGAASAAKPAQSTTADIRPIALAPQSMTAALQSARFQRLSAI